MAKSVSDVIVSGEESAVSSRDIDFAWVQRVQSGDLDAFDYLVTKYRKRLYSVIYNMTSNAEDAADLTQDSFIKAFSSIQRFNGKSAFYTWLYRIGVNTTIHFLRKNKYRRFFSFEKINSEGESTSILDTLAGNDASADRLSLGNELQEQLNEALQELPVKHRTVVVLHEIEGLSLVEVAHVLKISEGTARSRLHYAKNKLQGFLSHYLSH